MKVITILDVFIPLIRHLHLFWFISGIFLSIERERERERETARERSAPIETTKIKHSSHVMTF